MWTRGLTTGVLLAVLAGCSPAPSRTTPDATTVEPSVDPSVDPSDDGVLRLLFLGNSHTAHHDVPGTVAALVRAGRPGLRVEVVREPTNLHLEERAEHRPTLELLAAEPWDGVVLQAQDYSLSGRYTYPVDGARALVQQVRAGHAQAVLFAEWARRGVPETHRIVATYRGVDPHCLPPVPEAFDLALEHDPSLVLHAPDGNHSSAAGAFLASAVLARAFTGRTVAGLPVIGGIPAHTQGVLRRAADRAWEQVAPERRCRPF